MRNNVRLAHNKVNKFFRLKSFANEVQSMFKLNFNENVKYDSLFLCFTKGKVTTTQYSLLAR